MRKGTFFLIGCLIVLTVAGCQDDTTPSTGGGNVAVSERTVTDRDRLQGVWLFESIDSGSPKWKGEKGPDARVQFKGDQVIVTDSKDDSGEWFSLTLDPAKDPKWMTATRLDRTGKTSPPDEFDIKDEWIYKFEGEVLVIAQGTPIDPWKSSRPSEFKAQAWINRKPGQAARPSVILWRLKKTNEPFFQPVPYKPDKQTLLNEKLNQEISWKGGNLTDFTLAELLGKLAKEYNLNFVIAEEEFKKAGVTDIKSEKPKFAGSTLRELRLGAFLDLVLVSMNAKYIVRPDYIEITTLSSALEQNKPGVRP